MNYEETLELLKSYVNYERVSKYPGASDSFGTERMNILLEKLDNPHQEFAVLHIAGTKGKGSTAHLTMHILEKIGLRCGMYTSPHIVDLRERIQLDGEYISENEFTQCFSMVYDIIKDMSREECPTYFEILTAIAFLAFSRLPVDIAVVEVGLGGRLDATNVSSLPVAASAITPISHDHSAMLGDTLEEIATEKASIIRHRTPVIMGRQENKVAKVVVKKSRENDCKLRIIGMDINVELVENDRKTPAAQVINIKTARGEYNNVLLPLLGRHQLDNAGMAVALVEEFLESSIDESIFRDVWKDLIIPGRLEIVGAMPWILLDASHNPASVWALSECFETYFSECKKRILVFSACADKDVRAMLRILIPLFDTVVFTTNNSPRHVPANELAEIALDLYPNLKQDVKDNPLSAVDMAIHIAGEDGVVIVCGSMYLIGDTRDFCMTVGQFAHI